MICSILGHSTACAYGTYMAIMLQNTFKHFSKVPSTFKHKRPMQALS